MYIYKITNKVNLKFYIGKTTKTVEQRFKRHFYNHKTSNTYLYVSMRKHGFENFCIELLEETNINDIDDREMFWIEKTSPEYNMTKGGDGGDTSNSPNYIKNHKKNCRRGENHPRYNMIKENNPIYGQKRSNDTKSKMSKSHLDIRKTRRKECEQCKKTTDLPNYSRWHGNNCNLKERSF